MRRNFVQVIVLGSLVFGLNSRVWSQEKELAAVDAAPVSGVKDNVADPINLKPSKNMQDVLDEKKAITIRMNEIRQQMEKRRIQLMRENKDVAALRQSIRQLEQELTQKRLKLRQFVEKDEKLQAYTQSYNELQKSLHQMRMKMVEATKKVWLEPTSSPRDDIRQKVFEDRQKRDAMLKKAKEKGRIPDAK